MRRSTSKRLGLFSQPIAGQFVVGEEAMGLLPHLCVVIIHPFDLRRRQKRPFDQIAAQWDHRDMLKAQPCLITELMRCLDFANHNNVYTSQIEALVVRVR